MIDPSRAARNIGLISQSDPVAVQRLNLAQVRFLKALKDPKPDSLTIVLFLKPNRVGGSRVAVAAWSAIMFGTSRASMQCSPFGERWPFPIRSARLVSTSETLGDTGPLQKALKVLFPAGRYSQTRGVGKAYYSAGVTQGGAGGPAGGPGEWTWDAMSYGQDALAAAGSTMGLIVMSEPPPHGMFTECLTRLGGNGLMIVECTQLDMAGFLEEMVEDAGGRTVDGIQYGTLKLDGKPVGEIRVVRGDIEDSCSEHSNGHQSHSAIEATIAGWPAEEREARKTGKPLKLSGRIYPAWGDENELAEVPDWHAAAWERGDVLITKMLDPHDRKPWAMAWAATYPNEDVIVFQEWPPFDFNACKSSPVSDVEDYRGLILESEAQIGRPTDRRLIDKLFGNTPGKGTPMTLKKMLARPCRECLRHVGRAEYEDRDERSEAYLAAERACKHRLSYTDGVAFDGSIAQGHTLVRAALAGRPKLYAMRDACPNFIRGMRRYAWKENQTADRGLSDRPELVNKDYPDLIRNMYLKGWHRWPQDAAPQPKMETRPLNINRNPPPPPTNTDRSVRPRFK